ncbi:orotate phosphoribosyltransferase [Patescibacteria group bacterium]|nr:orotate phosphoribosyltransferase [Patescibacteria group bacterium]
MLHALHIGALELLPEGRTLKSGRVSPYFFNSGLFKTGEDLSILAKAYASALNQGTIPFDVIFGPAYKGIPLAATVAMKYAESYQAHVGYCFNRKEAKNHGEGGLLVGDTMLRGRHIALIDDVITDGATKEEAVQIVRGEGGVVNQLVLAFDRMERAQGKLSAAAEFEAKFFIPVSAAANLDDLLTVLKQQDAMHSMVQKIEDYRDQYGAL